MWKMKEFSFSALVTSISMSLCSSVKGKGLIGHEAFSFDMVSFACWESRTAQCNCMSLFDADILKLYFERL